MQEDRNHIATDPAHKDTSTADREEVVARITAELLGNVSKRVQQPSAASPAATTDAAQQSQTTATQKPAKQTSVLQKEISSATPDKNTSIAQEVAQNILQTDDVIRPFQQEDDKFRKFFTTTAVVLPKDLQETPEQDTAREAVHSPEKKPIFSWLRNRLSRPVEDDEDEEEDLDVFFPEEVAVREVFVPKPKQEAAAPVDETVQFDLFAMTEEPAPSVATLQGAASKKPKGKVRFVQEEPSVPLQAESPSAQTLYNDFLAPEEMILTPKEENKPEAFVPEITFETTPAQVPASVPVTDAVVAPAKTALPETQPDSMSFGDLTDEAEFLRQEIEMQTEAKDNFITSIIARIQDTKESLRSQPNESQTDDLQVQVLDEVQLQPVESAQVTEAVVEEAIDAPVASVDAPMQSERPVAQVQPQFEEAQEVATTAGDEADLLGAQEETEDLLADAPSPPLTMTARVNSMFASLQNAFKARRAAAVQDDDKEEEDDFFAVSAEEPEATDLAAEELAPVALAEIAAEEFVPVALAEIAAEEFAPVALEEVAAEEFAPVALEEVAAEEFAPVALEEVAAEEFAPVALAEVQSEALSLENIVEATMEEQDERETTSAQASAEEPKSQVAPEPTASEAQASVAATEMQPEETPEPIFEKPSYCLFDEEDDERAAVEQQGEIRFVSAHQQPNARLFDQDQAQVQDEPDDIPSLQLEAVEHPEEVPMVADEARSEMADVVASAVMDAAASAAVTSQADTTFNDFFAATQEELAKTSEKATVSQAEDTAPTQVESPVEAAGLLEAEDLQETPSAGESPFEEAAPQYRAKEKEALPEDPEGIQFGLDGMRAKLMLRTFTTAVFAAALFLLGLMAQGVVPTIDAIDPTSAPVPFLLVNLVLLLLAAGVSYPVFIDGITGLWSKPSPDTLAAIAGIAALLQLLLCLMLVEDFDAANVTIFSAIAGVVLFADALGSLVMAFVIDHNFALSVAGVPHHLAYPLREKDAVRTLSRGVNEDAPEMLVSRPVQQMKGFLEKSFSPRASDRRAQWIAYGLLASALVAYLIALVKGDGLLGAVSSFAAVICIGAPLSMTLLAALPSLCLQRAAASVGAMVPGWQAIESLGKINLVAVDAKELFPPLCAQLYGIKTFQKERVDLAILYATSILLESCDTLHGLFAGIIEYKENILYPVKDLENRQGQGFIGWCENYRVILGTRALMVSEGVPLPALDYEERYSKNGKRQVLYLSVSGQLYAMFLIGYRGEKSVARSLRTLRKEQIRLLVNSTDPTLSAARIEATYHLPAGFVTLLGANQASVLGAVTGYCAKEDGCMLHLGNFASLVGGLKAASAAAHAERGASTMQFVSAIISVLLSLFLCVTGGLMQVALVAILLYQVAWSALTLGIVLTKKFE